MEHRAFVKRLLPFDSCTILKQKALGHGKGIMSSKDSQLLSPLSLLLLVLFFFYKRTVIWMWGQKYIFRQWMSDKWDFFFYPEDQIRMHLGHRADS
jgi:hypothetical protein